MIQLLLLFSSLVPTLQHGYLLWPPNRSSLWRYGYNTTINYNDNALYCGGRNFLEESNGKCGVCGDPYVGPRKHEAGGIYASGIIAAKYPANTKTITVTVLLTVNHLGYFDFRLCPHNDPTVPVTQRCLDKHLLPIEEGSIKHRKMRFYPKEELGPTYNLSLEIPLGMICTQCVLQWRYHTENSWGMNPNGTSCKGCGLQEEFYNCADLSIGGDEHGSFNKYKSPHTTEPTLEHSSINKYKSPHTTEPTLEHSSINKYKSPHTTEPTLEHSSMDKTNRIIKQNTTELKVEKLNIRYLERNQSSKNHLRNYTSQLTEPARKLMKRIKEMLLSFGNDVHGQSLVLKSLGQIALSQNTDISSSNPGNAVIPASNPENTAMSPINHVFSENNVMAASYPKSTVIPTSNPENSGISSRKLKNRVTSAVKHENTLRSSINHTLSENTGISTRNPENTIISSSDAENTAMSPTNHVLSEGIEMAESNHENTVKSASNAENTAVSPIYQALSENKALYLSKPKNTVISANYPENTSRSSGNQKLSENRVKSSRNHLAVQKLINRNNSHGNMLDRSLLSNQQDQSFSSDRNELSPSVRSHIATINSETMTAHSKFDAEISKSNRDIPNQHTISTNRQTATWWGRAPDSVGLNKHSTTPLTFSRSTKPSIPSTLAMSRSSDNLRYTVPSPTTPSKSRPTVTNVRPTISLISRMRSAPRERMSALPVSLLSSSVVMPNLNSPSHMTASLLKRAEAIIRSSSAISKPKHIASSSTRVEEITPKLQSHNIQTFIPLSKNVIQSRTFVVKKGTGNKNKGRHAPVRRKYIIVRRVSKGGRLPKEIQELLDSSQYMIRRRKVSVPKNLIRNLKSQDLMKELRKQLPDLKNVHEFIKK